MLIEESMLDELETLYVEYECFDPSDGSLDELVWLYLAECSNHFLRSLKWKLCPKTIISTHTSLAGYI